MVKLLIILLALATSLQAQLFGAPVTSKPFPANVTGWDVSFVDVNRDNRVDAIATNTKNCKSKNEPCGVAIAFAAEPPAPRGAFQAATFHQSLFGSNLPSGSTLVTGAFGGSGFAGVDFATLSIGFAGGPGTITLVLVNFDGTYAAPKTLTVFPGTKFQGWDISTGSFNADTCTDLIAFPSPHSGESKTQMPIMIALSNCQGGFNPATTLTPFPGTESQYVGWHFMAAPFFQEEADIAELVFYRMSQPQQPGTFSIARPIGTSGTFATAVATNVFNASIVAEHFLGASVAAKSFRGFQNSDIIALSVGRGGGPTYTAVALSNPRTGAFSQAVVSMIAGSYAGWTPLLDSFAGQGALLSLVQANLETGMVALSQGLNGGRFTSTPITQTVFPPSPGWTLTSADVDFDKYSDLVLYNVGRGGQVGEISVAINIKN